jgi:hypothetical protein
VSAHWRDNCIVLSLSHKRTHWKCHSGLTLAQASVSHTRPDFQPSDLMTRQVMFSKFAFKMEILSNFSWDLLGYSVRKQNPCPHVQSLHRLTNYVGNDTLWPESASELYRPSDRRLSGKLLPIFLDIECHVVSVTDRYGSILGILDRSRYLFFHVAPQLCSRGWVDPVPGPLLLRKFGSARNRTRTIRQNINKYTSTQNNTQRSNKTEHSKLHKQ